MKEADIQRACIGWLAAEKIFFMRMNTGAITASHNGKKRFFRFGRPGCADIMTARWHQPIDGLEVCWLEIKNEKGQQSPDQKVFQKEVEAHGMNYHLIRSIEDLEKIFK